MTTTSNSAPLTKKDFKSDQDIRWCPGCGDYGILNAVQSAFAKLGKNLHDTVVISGIGCSSRFPYYMDTYGFHTIHGRAPALATGVKTANPALDVWVVTGDGDSLSIGGNHFIHALRRNVGLKILLFNNRIYGLTKGQYSPTSETGKTTKSSPMGSVDYPMRPVNLALGAGATFVARSIDTYGSHLEEIITLAAGHEGTALVEIYQNCNIFNDGAFRDFTDKPVRNERLLYLEPGQPMLFGDDNQHGIAMNSATPEIIDVNGDTSGVLVHNPSEAAPITANALARFQYPDMPVPMGIFRKISEPTYGELLDKQIALATAQRGEGDIAQLVAGENTWLVE